MGSGRTRVLVAVAIGVTAIAAVVVIGIALRGGNHSTSRKDYQAAVVTARDRVDFALGRLSKAQTLDELLERMDEAAAVIGDTADELNGKAPKGLENENARLVRYLEALATDIQGTADQARVPGFEDILKGASGLDFPSWDSINGVLGELKEAGIEVQPLSRHTT